MLEELSIALMNPKLSEKLVSSLFPKYYIHLGGFAKWQALS